MSLRENPGRIYRYRAGSVSRSNNKSENGRAKFAKSMENINFASSFENLAYQSTELYALVVECTASCTSVWPMDSKTMSELSLGQFQLNERLELGDWIKCYIRRNSIQNYKKVKAVLPTVVRNNNVWVNAKVSNITKIDVDLQNSSGYPVQYVGDSEFLGKIGFVGVKVEGDLCSSVFWITRGSINNRMKYFDVHWLCLLSISCCLDKERQLIEMSSVKRTSGNKERTWHPNVLVSSALIAVPLGEESSGLITSRYRDLGYVWSADFGEGLICHCGSFTVGDWVSFITSPIGTDGFCKYVARSIKLIKPLCPVVHTDRAVIVEASARIYNYKKKIIVFAEWFGEVATGVLENFDLKNNEEVSAIIRIRKKSHASFPFWIVVAVQWVGAEGVRKPDPGSANYESKVLRYLLENEGVRKALVKESPLLAASVSKFFGISLGSVTYSSTV